MMSEIQLRRILNHHDPPLIFDSLYCALSMGIHPTRFYQAVAAVTAISNEFEVDLIDGDTLQSHLSKTLEEDAIAI